MYSKAPVIFVKNMSEDSFTFQVIIIYFQFVDWRNLLFDMILKFSNKKR